MAIVIECVCDNCGKREPAVLLRSDDFGHPNPFFGIVNDTRIVSGAWSYPEGWRQLLSAWPAQGARVGMEPPDVSSQWTCGLACTSELAAKIDG